MTSIVIESVYQALSSYEELAFAAALPLATALAAPGGGWDHEDHDDHDYDVDLPPIDIINGDITKGDGSWGQVGGDYSNSHMNCCNQATVTVTGDGPGPTITSTITQRGTITSFTTITDTETETETDPETD